MRICHCHVSLLKGKGLPLLGFATFRFLEELHGNLRYPPKATPSQEAAGPNTALFRETNG